MSKNVTNRLRLVTFLALVAVAFILIVVLWTEKAREYRVRDCIYGGGSIAECAGAR